MHVYILVIYISFKLKYDFCGDNFLNPLKCMFCIIVFFTASCPLCFLFFLFFSQANFKKLILNIQKGSCSLKVTFCYCWKSEHFIMGGITLPEMYLQ